MYFSANTHRRICYIFSITFNGSFSLLRHHFLNFENNEGHMHVYLPLMLKTCRAVENITINYIRK